MEVAGAAEPLAGGDSAGRVLSRVMHQRDREVEPPLKGAEVGQQAGHFAGVVFVDSVQSHQGIDVQRVVTAGEGGVANIHVVKITKGLPHVHDGYDEAYYFISGTGTITLGTETSRVSPGTVAIIPAGVPHSREADQGSELEFVIFGTPPMSLEDERAKPRKM